LDEFEMSPSENSVNRIIKYAESRVEEFTATN
jgi:hypothetical protein